MNDEAAFVAAIKAAPADKNLPLIFADWLDDQGDPRGQWLRHAHIRPWMPPTYENPIPKLLGALSRCYRSRMVRRAAIAIGKPIVPGLIELLTNPSLQVLELACRCLRGIGKRAAAAAPALLELMADPRSSARGEASRTLAAVGGAGDDAADSSQLQNALADSDPTVRHAARRLLVSARGKESVFQDLIDQFGSPDANDRKQAVEGFCQLGTVEAVPHLERALDDADDGVQMQAVRALGALGRLQRTNALATAALCRACGHSAEQTRRMAAAQFGLRARAVPFTPAAIAAVAALLSDPSPGLRAFACQQLARAKELAAPAVAQLSERLTDPDAKVREAAIKALLASAKGSPVALAALVGQRNNPDPQYRLLVVKAVGAIGRGEPVAQAALVPLINDPDTQVAFAAIGELGHWPQLPGSLAPALLARFAERRTDRNDGSALLRMMGCLVPVSPEAIETLDEAVRNPGADYRAVAMEAVGRIGPAAVVTLPAIRAVLAEPQNRREHSAAVKALACLGPLGLNVLTELLATDDKLSGIIEWVCTELRAAALPLLPALLDRLRRVSDRDRRFTIIRLRSLGPSATAAIPALLDGLATWEDSTTRLEAVRSLTEFGPALVPHLARLGEVSSRAGPPELSQAFAALLARFAPLEAAVRDPLRESLSRAMQGDPAEKTNDRIARKITRQTCAAALLAFNDPALLPALAPLVTDPEVGIRCAILLQFDPFDTPTVLPLLRQALDDPDESVRLRAIEVLRRRADTSEETLAALAHRVEDRSPRVRRSAVCALGELKTGTEAVRAALTAATGDDDKKVAASAAVALKKVAAKRSKAKPATPKTEPPKAKGKKKQP